MATGSGKSRSKACAARRCINTLRSPGRNDFVILEVGTDLADSVQFKRSMQRRHRGRDLTPKLDGVANDPRRKTTYRTYKRSIKYTYLSKFHRKGIKDPKFQKWVKQLSQAKPVFLYLSGHHLFIEPTVFYNDNGTFAFAFGGSKDPKCRLQFGDDDSVSPKPRNRSKRIAAKRTGEYAEATSPCFDQKLLAIVADACNVCAETALWGNPARQLQERFSTCDGKPVVLGFDESSPPKGTAALHEKFLKILPRGQFTKMFKKGRPEQNLLVKYWMLAGKRWGRAKIRALDNQGNFIVGVNRQGLVTDKNKIISVPKLRRARARPKKNTSPGR